MHAIRSIKKACYLDLRILAWVGTHSSLMARLKGNRIRVLSNAISTSKGQTRLRVCIACSLSSDALSAIFFNFVSCSPNSFLHQGSEMADESLQYVLLNGREHPIEY